MMRWIWQSGETALADMAALHVVISAGMDIGCGGQGGCASSDVRLVAIFAGKVRGLIKTRHYIIEYLFNSYQSSFGNFSQITIRRQEQRRADRAQSTRTPAFNTSSMHNEIRVILPISIIYCESGVAD